METLLLWTLQVVIWITATITLLFLAALTGTAGYLMKETRGRDISVYGMFAIAIAISLALVFVGSEGWLTLVFEHPGGIR